MNEQERRMDELLAERPFRRRNFHERLQNRVLTQVGRPQRRRVRMIGAFASLTLFVVIVGFAGSYFWTEYGRDPAAPGPGVETTNPPGSPAPSPQPSESEATDSPAPETQVTLTEIAGMYRIYALADPKSATPSGYTRVYVERADGAVKDFDWNVPARATPGSQSPVTLQLADLNGDAKDELFITIDQTAEAGTQPRQIHVLEPEGLTEWTVQDPAAYLAEQTESLVDYDRGYAYIELKVAGTTYRRAMEATTTEPWEDRVDFGYEVKYELADGPTRLMARAAAAVGAATGVKRSLGIMDLSYVYADGGLRVEWINFQPETEVANEIPLYAIQARGGEYLKLQDWDNVVDLYDLLGEPLSEQTEQLGPNADTHNGSWVKHLKYAGIDLRLFSPKQNGQSFWLMNMTLTTDAYASSLGIRVGDTVQALQEAYPTIAIANDGRTDPDNCAYELNDGQLVRRLIFEVADGKIAEVRIEYLIQ